jgi:hypothetical protein
MCKLDAVHHISQRKAEHLISLLKTCCRCSLIQVSKIHFTPAVISGRHYRKQEPQPIKKTLIAMFRRNNFDKAVS